jgi:hypothetical protein
LIEDEAVEDLHAPHDHNEEKQDEDEDFECTVQIPKDLVEHRALLPKKPTRISRIG